MNNYSKEEIKSFEAKDLRITKIAILKSLIESGGNGNGDAEIEENCKIIDKYVNYIYGVKPVVCSDEVTSSVQTSVKSDTIDWKKEAEAGEVPIPTPENIKILRLVMDEYKQNVSVEGIKPSKLLAAIYITRGKYPINESSVPLVLKLI